MIHYHGTPISPIAKLLTLAGRCFCVSYADARDAQRCDEIGQSVMLDNGAFTYWRQGRAPDWPGYYRWCERWLERPTTWAVIPDVIDGTEQANDELITAWPYGTRGAPVWHLHESLPRLQRMLDEWPLVCLGSSGAFAKVGDPRWQRRMVDVMRVVCDREGRARYRVHMLRGLKFAGGPYPFYSADSSNIAQNHNGNNTRRQAPKDPRLMADRLDALQPPARFVFPPETMPGQLDLDFAA